MCLLLFRQQRKTNMTTTTTKHEEIIAMTTENEALAQILADNIEPKILTIAGTDLAIHGKDQRVTDLRNLLKNYLPRPDRRIGTVHIGRTQSLINFTNLYKGPESVIFATGSVTQTSIQALARVVFNYHPFGVEQEAAGHGDFVAEYKFPVSKELKSWIECNGKAMPQADFARFIEDRIVDMVDPQFHELGRDLTRVLAGNGADPITMLELSRGLEVRVNEQVKNVGRLQTGEVQLTFSVDHSGADGQPLRVPSWFIINVPVFEGDEPHSIPVRLRYRVKEGVVTWFYELFRIEKTFDSAFYNTLGRIQDETGLNLFITA